MGAAPGGRATARLCVASAAVLLAAADTYVVVLALPGIMADVGLGLQDLQKAAPIVSGFLLGYVVVLPLLGRLSDHVGRGPVFTGCLVVFAAGSLVTASAHDLTEVVAGRTLQGLGGGGMVPVTLALVADLWPPGRRGLPLGAVGAVQEAGSVLGPLYGSVVVALAGWRWIFWLNLPVAALVAAALALTRVPTDRRPRATGRPDVPGALLLLLGAGLTAVALVEPSALADSLTWGTLFSPAATGRFGALTTPVALAATAALLLAVAWEWVAPWGVRPLLPLRRLGAVVRGTDWVGGALLGGALAGVVVAFAAADPSRQVLGDAAAWSLPAAGVCTLALVAWERRCADPLIDLVAFARRPAWGSLAVNFAVGAALMAVLVDVPILARLTVAPDSQVQAALVLVRLLAAVPLGAVVGGLVCERVGYRTTAAAGMVLSGGMLLAMTTWTAGTLGERGVLLGVRTPLRGSDVWLGLCGLGFGLVIAPVNAAVLGAVRPALHGLASALVVVARMVGMLIGLAVLTAIGLRRYYDLQAGIPSPERLCPATPAHCPAYDALSRDAALSELHTIFAGAAVCALLAAVLAAALLQRGVHAASLTERLTAGGLA